MSPQENSEKTRWLVAIPLWILSVIAGVLLWQLFELNANMRDQNGRLHGTMNALQNLNSNYVHRMTEQNGYLSAIGNNIGGLKAPGK